MNIINSHYIPLAEPHNIIMAPGEDLIAEQIGILSIVEEAPTKGGGYGIKCHEHPVVRHLKGVGYAEDTKDALELHLVQETADGDIWTEFETKDCLMLCSVKERKISSLRLHMVMISRMAHYGEAYDLQGMFQMLKEHDIELVWDDTAKENHQEIILSNMRIRDDIYLQSLLVQPLFMVEYGKIEDEKLINPLDDDEIFFEFVNQARALLQINPHYEFHFTSIDKQMAYITDRLNTELNDYLERPDESK
ncbi:MAG: hypothetical protein J5671_09635 [Bacteroidaceae bacterium]|nr:hypothetical protein [Bacteroidaceae bacterium]